jgi:hypothetical protein
MIHRSFLTTCAIILNSLFASSPTAEAGANGYQMRCTIRGLPAFFFGPGCHDDYWILDGSFIGEVLAMLGRVGDAAGYADYLLLQQQADGRIQCMPRHWKETGIALVTLHRHAWLAGDREWLARRWKEFARAAEAVGTAKRPLGKVAPSTACMCMGMHKITEKRSTPPRPDNARRNAFSQG